MPNTSTSTLPPSALLRAPSPPPRVFARSPSSNRLTLARPTSLDEKASPPAPPARRSPTHVRRVDGGAEEAQCPHPAKEAARASNHTPRRSPVATMAAAPPGRRHLTRICRLHPSRSSKGRRTNRPRLAYFKTSTEHGKVGAVVMARSRCCVVVMNTPARSAAIESRVGPTIDVRPRTSWAPCTRGRATPGAASVVGE